MCSDGSFADVECADHVRDEALVGIGLDQRYVLIRRGVEDDLWTLALEELAHAAPVDYIGHAHPNR